MLPDTTYIRVKKKLNDKLLNDLAELDTLSIRVQRHIRQSTDASSLLVRRIEIYKVSSKKSHTNAPKNRRSILNEPIALIPVNANRMIRKRQGVEEKNGYVASEIGISYSVIQA